MDICLSLLVKASLVMSIAHGDFDDFIKQSARIDPENDARSLLLNNGAFQHKIRMFGWQVVLSARKNIKIIDSSDSPVKQQALAGFKRSEAWGLKMTRYPEGQPPIEDYTVENLTPRALDEFTDKMRASRIKRQELQIALNKAHLKLIQADIRKLEAGNEPDSQVLLDHLKQMEKRCKEYLAKIEK